MNLKIDTKHLLYFFIPVFFFVLQLEANAHEVTANKTQSTTNETVTFTCRLLFDGQMGTATPYIDYGDGSGEAPIDGAFAVPLGLYSKTYTISHAYSKKGTYTIRVRTALTGMASATAPNPAYTTHVVQAAASPTALSVNHISLFFDNNRKRITLKRNQKAPGLSVKIGYTGKGFLKGYWEIDGKRKSYVSKYLSNGPFSTLKYPDIPPMPTYDFGTHKVRFVITDPAMDINFPYVIYFIQSDEVKRHTTIRLLSPADMEEVNFGRLTLFWKKDPSSSLYLVNIYLKNKEKRVLSAYSKKNSYTLKNAVLSGKMSPDEAYLWNVKGFDDNNQLVSESRSFHFSFKR